MSCSLARAAVRLDVLSVCAPAIMSERRSEFLPGLFEGQLLVLLQAQLARYS